MSDNRRSAKLEILPPTPGVSSLSDIPTVELLRQHDLLTRYPADPLTFGRELFPHHFRLASSARWHGEAVALLTGRQRVQEFPNPGATITSLEPPSLPVPPQQFSAEISRDSVEVTRSPLRVAFHAPRG